MMIEGEWFDPEVRRRINYAAMAAMVDPPFSSRLKLTHRAKAANMTPEDHTEETKEAST